MLQSKDIGWMHGYKNKIHLYKTHKELTQIERHIDIESEGIEKYIICRWKFFFFKLG